MKLCLMVFLNSHGYFQTNCLEFDDVNFLFLANASQVTRHINPMEFYIVCRKCIYDKITDEELENCPVCNIDLGIVPLEKMRSPSLLF